MPFVAQTDAGDLIGPLEAADGVVYDCPSCGDMLKVRGGEQVCQHFWHFRGAGSCSGESDKHRRMKSIAMWKAGQRWPDADVGLEQKVGGRRADVLVSFSQSDDRLGYGVAIECQHKHEDKNVDEVNQDFLDAGYSVLWLYDEQFSEMNVDLDAGEWVSPWPDRVPRAVNWPLQQLRQARHFHPEGVLDGYDPHLWVVNAEDVIQAYTRPNVEARLPTEFAKWFRLKYWKTTEWDARFRGTADIEPTNVDSSVPARFEFEWFIVDRTDRVRRTIEKHVRGPQSDSVAVSSLTQTLVNNANEPLLPVLIGLKELSREDVITIEDGRVWLVKD